MAKRNKGQVFLVGAGPGDERLVSAAALDCIRRADVLVYDYLIPPALLEYRKPGAVLICAGKSPGRRSMPQDKINALLRAQALRGRTVARLKGGDPFLFGRGSEEALALAEAGIHFEIIPGVSSGFAVPAYAGIPLTHRGAASQVTFVTGREDPAKSVPDVEWARLAGQKGTLVIFMGMAGLKNITARLITHGMPVNTPVCVVERGTLPAQRSVTGTLASIGAAVKRGHITHPALIIIGEVVRLRKKLNWYESKPLFGKKILITRPRSSAAELSRALEREGARTFIYPLIEIVREKYLDERRVLEKLRGSDWIIFTSANAVEICFDIMKKNRKDARLFAAARIAVLGTGTEKELARRGVIADVIPEKFMLEGLLRSFRGFDVKGKRIFIPHSRQGRPVLVRALAGRGALVDEMFLYRVKPPREACRGELIKLIRRERFDAITFTSSSCVRQFMRLAGKAKKLLQRQTFAAIGPVTGQTLREFGYPAAATAKVFTAEGLVQAVKKIKRKHIYD